MKAEIILTVVWTSLCLSERQQRSTVLTDESKRIVEHFDFSNFDKQEALNYIDRQRFENQIRGKRSHTKFKRDPIEIDQNTQTELEIKPEAAPSSEENTELQPEVFDNDLSQYPTTSHESHLKLTDTEKPSRNRRGHRLKKKRINKDYSVQEPNENQENVDEELKIHRKKKKRRRKKKKKKKKKKKRKKKRKKKKKRHYWDKWSEWSPCSVTCGRGRKIRWRKCIAKNCTTGELEMGEKTCQLPACNLLTKLLGL